MKKFYLILTLVLCSLLGVQAQSQSITLPYYQDFAALTSGGTANSGNSQSSASASDVTGFAALVKGYQAGGVLRLGTSNDVGSLTTGTFTASGTNQVRVMFWAVPWTGATPKPAKVCVQYGSQSDTIEIAAATHSWPITAEDFVQYEALFTPDATGPQAVTISTLSESGLDKRIFMDNFKVSMMAPGAPLYEGFEGFVFPPMEWTTINTSGNVMWERYTSYTPLGAASASVDWSSAGSSNWLITPKMKVETVQTFSFKAKVASLYDATTLYVKVSNTGKATSNFTVTKLTLTDKVVMPNTLTTSWQTFTIDLSEYAGQEIYVAFHNVDNDGSRVMIDEINGANLAPVACTSPLRVTASNIAQTNSATVSWHDTVANGWIVEYSPYSNFSSNVGAVTVVDTTCVISDLIPGKKYYVRVKADCLGGDYSPYAYASVDIPCGEVDPQNWVETFDNIPISSYPAPMCWTKIPSTATYPYVSTSDSQQQDNVGGVLYFYGSSSNPVSLAASPMFSGSLDSSQISFYVKTGSASAEAILELGVMSDLTDATTFVSLYDATPLTRQAYEKHVVDLTGAPATHPYLALKMSVLSDYPSIYVDNMKLYKMPSCPMPQDFVIDSITASSARISWTENGTANRWELQYSTQRDFATDVQSVIVDSVSSATVTGLAPNSVYYIRVKSVCGEGGDESFWLADKTFATHCSEFDPLSWTESFENFARENSKPDCWTRVVPHILYSTEYPYVSSYNSYDNLGGGLYIYGNSLFATPRFSGTLSGSELTFYLKKSNAIADKLELGAMTDLNDTTTFLSLMQLNLSTTNEWTKFTYALSQLDSAYRYIAFKSTVVDNAYQYFYMDKLDLHPIPDCTYPSNFTVTTEESIAGGGFVIDAESEAAPEAWDIQYTLSRTTDTAAIRVTQLPYTVDSVGVGKTFKVRVRAICDTTEATSSDWTSWVTIQTECTAVNLPYYMGFDDTADGVQNGVGCLTATGAYEYYDWTYGYITYPMLTTDGHYDPISLYMYFDAAYSTSNEQTVIFPQFADPLNNASMAFYVKRPSSNPSLSHLEVRALTSLEDTTPIVVQSIPHTDVVATWTSFNVMLDAVPSTHSYLVLAVVSDSTGSAPEYVFDNITVEVVPDCASPSDFAVIASSDTSATFSWVANNGESQWVLEYRVLGSNDWIAHNVQVDPAQMDPDQHDATTTLTGLTASTTYEARVKAMCADDVDSRYTIAIRFTTDCLPVATINENFDAATIGALPDCWRKFSSDATYPKVVAASSNDGVTTPSVKFSGSKPQFLISPKIGRPLNEVMLSFDLDREGVSSGLFQVGVMSNPSDTSTFVHIATFDNNTYRTLIRYEVVFPNVVDNGSNRYIAFRYGDVGAVETNTFWYYWVDNVVVDSMPDCMPPTSASVSRIEPTEATISVYHQQGVNSFNYAYTSDNTVTDPSNLQAVDADSAMFVIENLTPNTEYKVWVRTNCNGAYSEWMNSPVRFRTFCEPVAQSIGYAENFDGVTTAAGLLPDCWAKISTNSTYPAVVAASSTDGLSTPSVKFMSSKPQYVVMPKMNDPLSTLMLRFNLVKEGASCGKFQVGVMSDPTNAATFVAVATLDNDTVYKQKVQHEVDFASVVDDTTNRYIVFRYGDVGQVEQPTYWYYWIDDVEIVALPTCLVVQDLQAVSTTVNSATIAFTPREGQTSWQYAISSDLSSDTPDANATYSVISNDTVTIGNLQANSSYRVWVRAICDESDSSAWTQYLDVRTACGVESIPYFETFDAVNASDASNAYCWTRVLSYTSYTTVYPYLSVSSSHDSIGNGYYMYLPSGSAPQMIASPEFVSLNNTEASMWVQRTGTGTAAIEVGVMADVADTTTFMLLGTITPTNTSWTRYDVPLLNIPATHKYFAVKASNTSNLDAYVLLDEIDIHVAPTCMRPSNLTVDANTITESSAEVSWIPNNNETNWVLYYKQSSATTWDSVMVSMAPAHTLVGLTPSTTYKVKVKSTCSPTESSRESEEVSFITNCAPSSLPFVETFEQTAMPPSMCWDLGYGLAENVFNGAAISSQSSSYASWTIATATATSMTTKHARLNIYGTSIQHWLITPEIVLPDSIINAQLGFKLALTSYSSASQPAQSNGVDDKFIVAISTDGGASWSANNATTWTNDGAGDYVFNELGVIPTNYTIDISQYVGGRVRVGFYAESTVGNADNYIRLDSIWMKAVHIDPAQVTTLPATNITTNSATLGKSVIQGTYSIESEGYYYRQKNSADPRFSSSVIDDITGLNPGTVYEYFAYAIAHGVTYYGDTLEFTTDGQASIPPTVTTLAATDITQTTAKLHKIVVADPSEPVTGSGWKYSVLGSNAWFDAPADSMLVGLQPNTTYEFYAYAVTAINPNGYPGATLTFRTAAHIAPTVVTGSAAAITSNSATISMTVTAGSENIISQGMKYRVETSSIFSDAPANGQLTSLIPNTKYYYFAYATTASFPMVSGDTLSFTTSPYTGIELAESSVAIYPNPAKDEVNIAIDGLTADATATIFDMQGKVVGKATVSAATGKTTVDVSTFADGTYIVRIVSKDIDRVERLIIKR